MRVPTVPDIPAFLRRAPGEIVPLPRQRQRSRKARPDNLVAIHLNDEIPRLGSGRRYVEVAKTGRKWITIRPAVGGKAIRVHRRVWDQVRRVA